MELETRAAGVAGEEVHIDPETGELIDKLPTTDENDEYEDDERAEETAGAAEGADEGPAGETDEQKRERRRLERKNRRDYQRQRSEERERQLQAQQRRIAELEERLNGIDQQGASADLARVDNELRRTAAALETVKARIKAATEANDGDAMVEAQELFFKIRERGQGLNQLRQRIVQAQRAPQPMDADVYEQTTAWMERNRWYDVRRQDRDSKIVADVDKELTNEGWDPRTKDYWDELDRRAAKHLPHRYKLGYNKPNGQSEQAEQHAARQREASSPVSGSARSVRQDGKRTVTLSAARVQALKDAGKWDDPKERAKAIKSYEDWDKANAS